MAESLEGQSGRTEGSTSGIRAVGKRREQIQVNVRVIAATIRGSTPAQQQS